MKMPLSPDNADGNVSYISIKGEETPRTLKINDDHSFNKRCADGNEDRSVKRMLQSFSQMIFKKLDNIENRLDNMKDCCQEIEDTVEMLSSIVKESNSQSYFGFGSGSTSVYCADDSGGPAVPFGTNITLITLNTESDFPLGSWLGDENNPEMRVRCHIPPADMFHINTNCRSAEKMALTLLDYLFDREVQAYSNISGAGKHKKKKLDPLMIYGIRCHLIHKFQIKPSDWNRIKQNMDSKCRTAFRRKKRGLPLSSKHISGTFEVTSDSENSGLDMTSHSEEFELQTIEGEETGDLFEAQIIRTEHGDIQVLHATPEQIIQLKKLQFISGEQLLTAVENDEGTLELTPIES